MEGYRLSPQQKHLWMLQQKGLTHQAQCAILLEGELDVEKLEDSVRRVIDQCEILRTDFKLLPQLTTPVQVIAEQGELVWGTGKLTMEIEQLLENEKQLLSRNVTQVRATLAEIGSQRNLLVLTLPALCSDTTSLNSLMKLIAGAYEGNADDEETAQYVQFSEWQNELLEDEEPEGKAWWQQNPGTNGHGVLLPLERAGAQAGTSVIEQPLSEADVAAIAKIENASHFLFACWQVLLWRLGQQAEFSINYVCDGRKYEELASALGLFAKAVPVTGRFEEGMRFGELLDQLGEATRNAYAWQENYPYQQNGASAQQTIGFEFAERPENISAHAVTFSIHKQSHRLENFKLHLYCVRSFNSIVAELHYDAAHFDAGDVKRLGAQFATIVRSALANPHTTIDELEILDEAERRRLLFEWNQTITDDDINRVVHELFEEQVERTPDRVAVVCRNNQLTYTELNERANCLAHRLRRLGVGPGTPVGLYLERSIEVLVGLIGILKAGGAYVPLDPEHPTARLALQLAEIEAPVLVTQASLAGRLKEFSGETICLDSDDLREKMIAIPSR